MSAPKATDRTDAPAEMARPGGNGASSESQEESALRRVSTKFLESAPPSGMWHATGTSLAQAPTTQDIRRGDFGHSGWDSAMQRRNSNIAEESVSRTSSGQTPASVTRTRTNPLQSHVEADEDDDPFARFLGRQRIDGQSYVKKNAEDSASLSDDYDSIDELEERPRRVKRKTFDKDQLANVVTAPRDSSPPATIDKTNRTKTHDDPDADGVYPNGYRFPAKHTWAESSRIGLKALWRFAITPLGFFVVLYGLNVIAWGGMIFLLLIGGGSQFMCFVPGQPGVKDCNDLNTPRRKWIEYDSQILTALFCVTGFGLIPWRFRDLYYLLKYRVRKDPNALRRLAGIHNSWFRLPGNHRLPSHAGWVPRGQEASYAGDADHAAVPLPTSKAPCPPLTGVRAYDTAVWKMDFVIWSYVANTALQAVLCGFMWGMNRYNRPSWATGLFVSLACIVAAMGGLMCFIEGKRIKAMEGIPAPEAAVMADIEKQTTSDGHGARVRASA